MRRDCRGGGWTPLRMHDANHVVLTAYKKFHVRRTVSRTGRRIDGACVLALVADFRLPDEQTAGLADFDSRVRVDDVPVLQPDNQGRRRVGGVRAVESPGRAATEVDSVGFAQEAGPGSRHGCR